MPDEVSGVEAAYDELSARSELVHRLLDAQRARADRLFALVGVLAAGTAALVTGIGGAQALLLGIPALLAVIAFGLVWLAGRGARHGDRLWKEPVAESATLAARPARRDVRGSLLPSVAEAMEQNQRIAGRRSMLLTRAELTMAAALVALLVVVLAPRIGDHTATARVRLTPAGEAALVGACARLPTTVRVVVDDLQDDPVRLDPVGCPGVDAVFVPRSAVRAVILAP